MIVTSNRDTAEWLAMFDDVLLAQSAVDRFKNAAYDFVIEGESYRPRLKPKLAAEPPPTRPSRRSGAAPDAPLTTSIPTRNGASSPSVTVSLLPGSHEPAR